MVEFADVVVREFGLAEPRPKLRDAVLPHVEDAGAQRAAGPPGEIWQLSQR